MMNKLYNETSELKIFSPPKPKVIGWGLLENFVGDFIIQDPNQKTHKIQIIFGGDMSCFMNNEISFNINIIRRQGNSFSKIVYSEVDVRYHKLIDGVYEFGINLEKLDADNEFVLNVSFNTINNSNYTYIEQKQSDLRYGLANKDDAYVIVLKDVDKPIMSVGIFEKPQVVSLVTQTEITKTTIRSIVNTLDYSGSLIITIDGLTMSEGHDYTINNNIILFNETLPKGSIITLTGFSKGTNSNGLNTESYLVSSKSTMPDYDSIVEGVFFSTEKNNFGVMIRNGVLPESEPIVVLNGQKLLFNSDYYVDKNDNTTIYLSGILLGGDILTIYYLPEIVNNEVNNGILPINISIENPITNENGMFEVQISKYKNFDEYSVASIDYEKGQSIYVLQLEYPEKGVRYVRVNNRKTYTTINDKKITINKESNSLKINFV